MGFADYLSRNPSWKPAPGSEDDEKIVINTTNEMKHPCLKHIIKPNNMVKQTGYHNQPVERKQIEQNDVTHDKEKTKSEQNAFCLNTAKNKSLLTAQNFNSLNNTKLIAFTTRNNPNRNTFVIEIKKRKRAPNKKYPNWIYIPALIIIHPQINKEET